MKLFLATNSATTKTEKIMNEEKNNTMKVGICLFVKNCYGPYLHDWLQYHTDLGVDVFYIYDNESEPSVRDTLGLSLMDYNVQLLRVEGRGMNVNAYNSCIESIKNNTAQHCDWVAFIDDDEYIVCENNDIKATLQKYDTCSGVGINWLMYGSSGLKTKTPVSPRKKFTKHVDPEDNVNKHIKSIVKPLKVKRFRGTHACFYEEGACHDVEFNQIDFAFSNKPIHHTIWLNHYYAKTEEEFMEKIKRGKSDTADPTKRRTMEEFYEMDNKCVYSNKTI